MKFIIVEHRSHYSGASSQRLLGYAKALINKGHEVVMIISPQTPFPPIAEIRFVEIEETRKHIFRCYWQFINAIKREYDSNSIIYFYEPQIYSVFFRSPKYRVFSEQTEIPNYGLKVSLLRRILEAIKLYANKHFSGVAVISNGLKDYYKKKGIKHIEVINMFVDANRFNIIKSDSDIKYIAYCGTISVFKDGADTLIRAFCNFHQTYPEYKLYLIGQFDLQGSEQILRKLITDLDLEESVVFKGRINANDLPLVLSGARMLALARPNTIQSQYGFPTKLGEYLATGNPVVVTKVGEIPMYLRDGVNAFLANPDDVESFAEKLLEVERDYNKSIEIGAKGRELVFSEFSNIVQSEKLLHYIENVISQKQ